jgi:hypothetical protein
MCFFFVSSTFESWDLGNFKFWELWHLMLLTVGYPYVATEGGGGPRNLGLKGAYMHMYIFERRLGTQVSWVIWSYMEVFGGICRSC